MPRKTASSSAHARYQRRQRQRRSRRMRFPQRGGSGQMGRTVMSQEYFGTKTNNFVKTPPETFKTAYGCAAPTSFGVTVEGLGDEFLGPNLAPGGCSDTNTATGTQTGGGRRGQRGRARTARTRRTPHKRKQRGGGGQQGRTVLPLQYFGGKTETFTSTPPKTFKTAYGCAVPTSFGATAEALGPDFLGPNLAPGGPYSTSTTTGIQTGGGGRRPRASRRRGASKKKRGGRVTLPIEYFGGKGQAYVSDPGTLGGVTADGPMVASSFGASNCKLGAGFRGPNLAPSAVACAGCKTGGRRRRGAASQRNRSRRASSRRGGLRR